MGRKKQKKPHDWREIRAAERAVREMPVHGAYRLALAYANTYHIGMSSLGFQRTYELVHRRPDWVCERFFSDGEDRPLSVEHDRPLDEFGCVAFSVSFEEDYVRLLQMLDRAGIPLRREERRPWDPVLVMGGSCATINPLPMAEFVDVFALGAAENVLEPLQRALERHTEREAVIEELAAEPGFFVPAYHATDELGGLDKLKKLELGAEQMRQPGFLPTTSIVTPHTEFANKFLIEMSRGCPEKCRYCWATFGMGKFRWHPTEYILGAMEEARKVTDQVGFVATAVGDHPEIERILERGVEMGFRTSVSSIRIPAVSPGVLEAIKASGGKSITLAPETGTDELRVKMGKPISNQTLLEKIRLIFRSGLPNLKLYFIVGLPDETEDDVYGILELAAEARAIMLEELARKKGIIGHIHLGASVLVPKPYTPWQRLPMDDPRTVKKKLSILKKGAGQMPNVSLSTGSVRQAIWQTYISRAGADAAEALERAARGQHLSSLLRELDDQIRPEVFASFEGPLRWHFMATR
ncbi:MAG: radical SAM protein [Acidobacteriota bacterium]|nr:radical SAM protein [Acidobacteriota bacterium]